MAYTSIIIDDFYENPEEVRDFALENNYDQSHLVKILNQKRKTHKDIIKMEYLNAKN